MEYTMDKVRPLPGSMGIMVVDAERFSVHNDIQQKTIVPAIPDVLEEAARLCGLPQIWAQRKFPISTGDGYVIGIDESLLPHVLHGYLTALQVALRERNERLRSQGITLRLRLSLNTGPMEMIDDLRLSGPPGNTVVDTHRLVDCPQLRRLLESSDPDVTYLAAAIAEPVIAKAVRTGYAARAESEYVRTPVAITAKDYRGVAYLHVPTLSGDLLAHGLLGVQTPPETESETVAPTEPEAAAEPEADTPTQSTGDTEGVAVNIGGSADNARIARDIDNSRRTDTTIANNAVANHVGRDMNQVVDTTGGDKNAPTTNRGLFGRLGNGGAR